MTINIEEFNEAETAAAEPTLRCIDCGNAAQGYERCDRCIEKRHIKLRGSSRLLFVLGANPRHRDFEPACTQRCGCGGKHPCQLRFDHLIDQHIFTSECLMQRNAK